MFGGSMSLLHWAIVLLVIMLLFGTGKVSSLMGDFAKGIKSFKKNMADDSDVSAETHVDRPAGSIAASNAPRPTSVGSTSETVHHG